jgi:hypothetical protein
VDDEPTRPTNWSAVFHLPVSTTWIISPSLDAIARRPVIDSSRDSSSTTNQPGIRPSSAPMTSVAMTMSLSAKGSRSLPMRLSWPRRRASQPSSQSVAAAAPKSRAAKKLVFGVSQTIRAMTGAMAAMRISVRTFGRLVSSSSVDRRTVRLSSGRS